MDMNDFVVRYYVCLVVSLQQLLRPRRMDILLEYRMLILPKAHQSYPFPWIERDKTISASLDMIVWRRRLQYLLVGYEHKLFSFCFGLWQYLDRHNHSFLILIICMRKKWFLNEWVQSLIFSSYVIELVTVAIIKLTCPWPLESTIGKLFEEG